MKKLRCIIVDDKPLAIDILKAYIGKTAFLELVYTAQNPLDALAYIAQHAADVLFLDIQMPELNGMGLMRLINGRLKVILCTAYAEYALEGYEHDVIDYLLKPVSFERFYKAALKAQKLFEGSTVVQPAVPVQEAARSIFIKTEYKLQQVELNQVLFVEARQNYIALHLPQKQLLSLQNIKSMEEKLPAAQFVRVHKSYIVAIDKIESVEKGRIVIAGHSIPIGENYREHFFRIVQARS